MDRRPRTGAVRSYVDCQPVFRWVREEGADTILVELPDFTKQQLRVQLENSRNLKIRGERPLGDNKWSHFLKEFQTPENCNTKEIHAKFERRTLKVTMPKMITGAYQQTESKTKVTIEAPTEKPESMLNSPKGQDEKVISGADKIVASKAKPTRKAPNIKKPESMRSSHKGQDEKTITRSNQDDESMPKQIPEAPTTKNPESILPCRKDQDEAPPTANDARQVNEGTKEPTIAKTVAGKDSEEKKRNDALFEALKATVEKESIDEKKMNGEITVNATGSDKFTYVDSKEVAGVDRLLIRLREQHSTKFVINVAVASFVVVVFGVYVAYMI